MKKFIGVNWLTGRKIYLTSEEETMIKKQRKKVLKVFFWILGIYILSMVVWFIWMIYG